LSATASSSASMMEVGTILLEGGIKSITKAGPSASMLEVGILALKGEASLVQQPVPLHLCGKWVAWLKTENKLSATASSSASMM